MRLSVKVEPPYW